MRYLKRLLAAIYAFLGAFAVMCFVMWCVTGTEPTALITGVFAAAGVESVAGVMIKFKEAKDERSADVDIENNGRGE